MQEFNGLGVILENRYYGQSYPFNTSTTDNLAYLTTEQSPLTLPLPPPPPLLSLILMAWFVGVCL